MKRGFRFLSLLLAVLMIASLIAACSNKDAVDEGTSPNGEQTTDGQSAALDYLNETGLPIVKEPITIKVMSNQTAGQANNADMPVIKKYEEMTGIHVEWELVPWDNTTERKNLALASQDYADVFIRMFIDATDIVTYGSQQGVFLKLNDYIDKYAPNLKAFFDQNPDVAAGLTAPDGGIYAFPRLIDPDFLSMRLGDRLWISEGWLNKVGLKEPATTEELYNALKAFKEQDPNGNGNPDEIPLTGQNLGSIVKNIKGAWGLGNRGNAANFVDMDETTNQLRFWPADEKYRDMVEYLRKLYEEKLLDQEIFTSGWDKVIAKANNGVVGAYAGWSPTLLTVTDYTGIGVLEGPQGDKIVPSLSPVAETPFMAVITDKNKYPEATVRWLDYMYSEEGAKLFNMGIEGETYTVDANGEYVFTDVITNNPNGLNQDQARGQYMPSVSGWPGITMQKYFKGSESTEPPMEAAEKSRPYVIKEVWPQFIFTPEENDRLVALRADIEGYVNEIQEQVISGKYSFDDEGWNRYLDQLKQMGLDEYLNIYKAAYDRYSQAQ